MNNANWQWLSCSNFFYQYYRCYSPIAFGKKTDPKGVYIRKWLPQLASYPDEYIYEPWKAPLAVQRACGCVVGEGYPTRIVIHEEASRVNMERMKRAYSDNASSSSSSNSSNSNSSGSSSSSSSTATTTAAADNTAITTTTTTTAATEHLKVQKKRSRATVTGSSNQKKIKYFFAKSPEDGT